jgi:hypothetical protein
MNLPFSDSLITTVFDVFYSFVASSVLREDHWAVFFEHARRWRHHERIVMKWNFVLRLLTRRLVQVLLGFDSKAPPDSSVG